MNISLSLVISKKVQSAKPEGCAELLSLESSKIFIQPISSKSTKVTLVSEDESQSTAPKYHKNEEKGGAGI